MDTSSLRNIERLNYMLGAVLVAGAAFVGTQRDVLGVLVGVALSCANFSLMRRMVQWWLGVAAERRTSRMALLLPKMMAVMAAVTLAVVFLPVSGLGVMIGFSVFLGSIAIEFVRFSVAGPARRPEPGAGGPGAAGDRPE